MEKTLESILGDFSPSAPDTSESVRYGGSIAVWLPSALKARYDALQERSGKRFSKKVREAVVAMIELAEARAQ
jgi:predicted DNA-binding protein